MSSPQLPSTPERSSPVRITMNSPTSVETPPKDSYTSLSSLMKSGTSPSDSKGKSKERRASASKWTGLSPFKRGAYPQPTSTPTSATEGPSNGDTVPQSPKSAIKSNRRASAQEGGAGGHGEDSADSVPGASTSKAKKTTHFALGQDDEATLLGAGDMYGTRSASRSRERDDNDNNGKHVDGNGGGRDVKKSKSGRNKKMSIWKMMALTISMGGAQIAWVVELGYGTPYLLSLGLSAQLTSLVWLAGPISGLIAQPLIGAISDTSPSSFRRRYWIIVSTMLLCLAGLSLAFTEPLAQLMVGVFGRLFGLGGLGDWDPKWRKTVQDVAIWIAIVAFYCLDFGLNALQASLRNLVLDVTPGEQLATANAWHGRFNHMGNIVGFFMGSLNLNGVPILRDVGGGQFRKLCIVAISILVLTVWITVVCITEEERIEEFGPRKGKMSEVFVTIFEAINHLPKPVRRVCYVQLCTFMGWFSFLFYSSTWVAQVMEEELGHPPDVDTATRAGSVALLIYSFVAIVAGTLLPYLASRDHRLLAPEKTGDDDDDSDDEDNEDVELKRIKVMVREWKLEAAREGKPLKLPTMPFMLRNIWTSALLFFAVVMWSSFFINKVWQATIAISVVGICWAVACWVPFAIIMEFLKEIEDKQNAPSAPAETRGRRAPPDYQSITGRPTHPARAASTPAFWSLPTERTALVRSMSTTDIDAINEDMSYSGTKPAGGTLLGCHNVAITIPQFAIAFISSMIFRASGPGNVHSVAHVLQFGGMMSLVAALVSRRVPPTKTEKAMRRRLAEMREESDEAV